MGEVVSGQYANQSGKAAEDVVDHILTLHGISHERQVQLGTNIYGRNLRCDFVAMPTAEDVPARLAIEVKHQDVAGTADEKLVFVMENIRSGQYGMPVLLLLVGDGFSAGCVEWVRAQAGQPNVFAVMSLNEFFSWAVRLGR